MKILIKNTEHIGKIIKMARVSQDLDQFSAANLSGVGQSFLSHIENGKETAQISKVLDVLASLGVRVELTVPLDFKNEVFKNFSTFDKSSEEMPSAGISTKKETLFQSYFKSLNDIPAPDAETVFEYMDNIMSKRVKRS